MPNEAQALADRLAELAGWRNRPYHNGALGRDYDKWCKSDQERLDHPFPPNSLDALERFRRERLPGWEWDQLRDTGGPVGWRVRMTKGEILHEWCGGPDEWSARASALIAACTKEPPHAQP